jgi:D-3-phosphoglycerate dehydrogenase
MSVHYDVTAKAGQSVTKRIFYVNIYGQPVFADILSQRSEVELAGLRDDTPDAVATAVIAGAHAYQVSSGAHDMAPRYRVDSSLLGRAPSLLLVSTIGAGYDPVDVDACTRAGVIVVNQSGGGNAEAVAEHVLAMMLCLSKRIIEADRHMRREPGIVRGHYTGRNARGKTIGIIGLGNVGTRLAELCRNALQMRVLVCDRHRSAAEVVRQGAEKVDLDDLLRSSDFVSICCSLTEETRGMIGAPEFALMPAHAYFITAARGGIHDEAALVDALRGKRIAGAGIDVWDVEPPAPEHPLLQFDNVIATPHTGGATIESRIQASEGAARQILDVFDGKRPPRLLNPEAWPAYCNRFERAFGFRPVESPSGSVRRAHE